MRHPAWAGRISLIKASGSCLSSSLMPSSRENNVEQTFCPSNTDRKKTLEIFVTITGYFKLDRPIFSNFKSKFDNWSPLYVYLRILSVTLFKMCKSNFNRFSNFGRSEKKSIWLKVTCTMRLQLPFLDAAGRWIGPNFHVKRLTEPQWLKSWEDGHASHPSTTAVCLRLRSHTHIPGPVAWRVQCILSKAG